MRAVRSRGFSLVCVCRALCCLNFMPLSSLTPRIVVHGSSGVGIINRNYGELEKITCAYGLVLYSLLYDVISVDLLVETFSLFVVSNTCKYACCCLAVVSCLEYCVRTMI